MNFNIFNIFDFTVLFPTCQGIHRRNTHTYKVIRCLNIVATEATTRGVLSVFILLRRKIIEIIKKVT